MVMRGGLHLRRGRLRLQSVPALLLAFEHNGLVLVDPALVLYLALYRVITMHGPDDGADAAHVEEEVFTDEAVVESVDLVPHSDRHVLLRGDMRLICCDL